MSSILNHFCVGVCTLALGLAVAGGLTAQETEERAEKGGMPSFTPGPGGGDGMTGAMPVFSVLKFSGRMRNTDGTALTGTVGVTFAFYSEQAGGSPLWVETHNIVLDNEGRYTVLLGSESQGLPLEIFTADEARWLGVQPFGQSEQPRVLLVSVPYAMKAAEAERLGGRSAEEFVLSEGLEATVRSEIRTQLETEVTTKALTAGGSGPAALVDGTGTIGAIPRFTAADVIGDSIITDDGAGLVTVNGRTEMRAGVGQTRPFLFLTGQFNEDGIPPVEGMLRVNNASGDGFGLRVDTGGTAIWGASTITTGFKAALFGSSAADNGRGILARAVATTGAARAIEAETEADSGFGILLRANHPSGATTGAQVEVTSPAGTGIVVNAKGGGKVFSGQNNGVETVSIDAAGNVTATSFVGDGSALKNIVAASTALAGNSDLLDGLDSTQLARVDAANTFVNGNQIINDSLGVGTATPARKVDVVGNVRATAFEGDGSGLTNLDANATIAALLAKIEQLEVRVLGGGFQWVDGFGDLLDDQGRAVAVDSSGNVLVTGSFQGTVDFDPGSGIVSLTSAGGTDIFIAKYSGADGSLIWVNGFGSTGTDDGRGVTVDSSGNVVVTGSFQGTVDFDPGAGTVDLTSSGDSDILLAKYSGADGSLLWADGLGSSLANLGNGVAVDSSGNVYVTGTFQDVADFDPSPLVIFPLAATGLSDIFLAKYSGADGSLVWAERFGALQNFEFSVGVGVTVDSSSNVVVTGSFSGTVDFDPGIGTLNFASALNAGGFSSFDMFLGKYSGTDGSLLWAEAFNSADTNQGRAVTVNSTGDILLAGVFGGTVDFDPGAGIVNLTSAGGTDILIAKYSGADGSLLWANGFGSSGAEGGTGVAVDSGGDVLVTGSFQNTVDFDPTPGLFNLNSAGGNDIFVAKYNGLNGNLTWAKAFGATLADEGRGLTVDSSGNVVVTGLFSGTVDFDPDPGTVGFANSNGGSDIFLVKLRR